MNEVSMEGTVGKQKKGMGLYTLIAVLILVVGLVFTFSISNYRTYQFKDRGDSLTLWKGKFTPKGTEKVESFESVILKDEDLRMLTGQRYASRDAAYRAIFSHLMDQITVESAKGDEADLSTLNTLLNEAESVFGMIVREGRGVAGLRFQLAQKRVTVAELTLQEVYRKAMPVYKDAVKSGLGDARELEPKMEAMQMTLGLVTSRVTSPQGHRIYRKDTSLVCPVCEVAFGVHPRVANPRRQE